MIMKRNIIFIMLLFFIVFIMSGCSQADPSVTQEARKMGITTENYPKIDGSTSALPIIQGIYKEMFNPEIIDGQETWNGLPQSASKTIESYKKLIDGEVDLIIVPAPSEEVKKLAEEKGAQLEYIPVCLEALIFIVNTETTVNDISTEEIKNIYVDAQINNWSQLGDKNIKIEALTRNIDSGSYALLEKFILNGEKVNKQIEEYNLMLDMISIIEEIENPINRSSSKYGYLPLGYTLYYFFQNNKIEQKWSNVKMLSINGVEPNNETIVSGEYPYTTNYYAVIKEDSTSVNSPTGKLVSWLTSPEGQKIFVDAGFGIIK